MTEEKTLVKPRTLTPIPIKLSDAPILNMFLKSKIWVGDVNQEYIERYSERNDNHAIIRSKGKNYRSYELLCLILMHYNRKDEFDDDGVVEIDFDTLSKHLKIKSRYDNRLAKNILKQIEELKDIFLTTFVPKEKSDGIMAKIDSIVSNIRVSCLGADSLEVTHHYAADDDRLIENAEFLPSSKVYRIKVSSALIAAYKSYGFKYQHIDFQEIVDLSTTAKSLHRYFSTKFNVISVKRSTLIDFVQIKPDQESKTLNYKLKKWLKELESLNVIKVLDYQSKSPYKNDPLIKILIIHKKEREGKVE